MLANFLQPANVEGGILVIVFGNEILVKFLQSSNVLFPKLVTLLGTVILVNP